MTASRPEGRHWTSVRPAFRPARLKRAYSRAIGPDGPITVKPKGLTGLKARQRATAYGYALYPTCLPTNGHSHQACAKPVTGSHFRSTNCLATSGHVKQRQRQRRRLHDSHCGVMCCQVWRKNLRTLVSSNAKPTAWPGLILSGLILYGLILYAACQIMACLMPGLFSCWRVACQVMA